MNGYITISQHSLPELLAIVASGPVPSGPRHRPGDVYDGKRLERSSSSTWSCPSSWALWLFLTRQFVRYTQNVVHRDDPDHSPLLCRCHQCVVPQYLPPRFATGKDGTLCRCVSQALVVMSQTVGRLFEGLCNVESMEDRAEHAKVMLFKKAEFAVSSTLLNGVRFDPLEVEENPEGITYSLLRKTPRGV